MLSHCLHLKKGSLAHEINDFPKFLNIFTNRLEQLKERTTAGASTCQLMLCVTLVTLRELNFTIIQSVVGHGE